MIPLDYFRLARMARVVINKQGMIVINPQFDSAGLFSDGLAIVLIGEKFSYID